MGCEIRRHINIYVQNSLFPGTLPPQKSNKQFRLGPRTIKNRIYIAVIKQCLAKVDQANLLEKVYGEVVTRTISLNSGVNPPTESEMPGLREIL